MFFLPASLFTVARSFFSSSTGSRSSPHPLSPSPASFPLCPLPLSSVPCHTYQMFDRLFPLFLLSTLSVSPAFSLLSNVIVYWVSHCDSEGTFIDLDGRQGNH